MIERVARGMYEAQVGASVPEDLWAVTLAHPAFVGTLATARAAIAAMREPTDEMVTQCANTGHLPDDAVVVWQRMIDEALKPK